MSSIRPSVRPSVSLPLTLVICDHIGSKQASREPQRGRGKHYRGALSPHSVCLEIEKPKVSRGRKSGERCPLTIRLGVRGSVASSPSGVRGRAKKWILCIFQDRKKPPGTSFSVFLSPAVAGPGETPHFSPLSTGLVGKLGK